MVTSCPIDGRSAVNVMLAVKTIESPGLRAAIALLHSVSVLTLWICAVAGRAKAGIRSAASQSVTVRVDIVDLTGLGEARLYAVRPTSDIEQLPANFCGCHQVGITRRVCGRPGPTSPALRRPTTGNW